MGRHLSAEGQRVIQQKRASPIAPCLKYRTQTADPKDELCNRTVWPEGAAFRRRSFLWLQGPEQNSGSSGKPARGHTSD